MSIGLSSILSPADEENALRLGRFDDTVVYVIFRYKGPEREFGTKRLTLEYERGEGRSLPSEARFPMKN